jgi:hypothetical protein
VLQTLGNALPHPQDIKPKHSNWNVCWNVGEPSPFYVANSQKKKHTLNPRCKNYQKYIILCPLLAL